MPLTKYTESTLLPKETIRYAASLHKFHFIVALCFIAFGLFMAMPSGGEVSIQTSSDTANYYIASAIQMVQDFLRTLPVEVQSFVATTTALRSSFTGMLILIVGIFILVNGIIKKISVEMVITNRKIMHKKGLVEVNETQIPLDRIEGVKVQQTALDRIIGRGSILVTGIGMEMIELKKIADPAKFRINAYQAIEDYKHELSGR